ncbi:hypothetical protein FF1_003778 [Malus domestica]
MSSYPPPVAVILLHLSDPACSCFQTVFCCGISRGCVEIRCSHRLGCSAPPPFQCLSSSSVSGFGVLGMFLNGWRSRVAADPQFPFKVLMEEVFYSRPEL